MSGEGGLDIDYNEVWSWIRKLAEQGYDTAQAWLGVQYSKAEQGYAKAQCHLGFQYSLGYGVKSNKKKARYRMQKAAAQGDERAIEWLQKFD